jgi:hypothetical protein
MDALYFAKLAAEALAKRAEACREEQERERAKRQAERDALQLLTRDTLASFAAVLNGAELDGCGTQLWRRQRFVASATVAWSDEHSTWIVRWRTAQSRGVSVNAADFARDFGEAMGPALLEGDR